MGLAAAIAFPGWYSIFTKHVDKGKEGFEWSLYDVVLGLGMAGMAALGGFLADAYGFNVLFVLISGFTLMGALLLLVIKNRIYTGKKAMA
jgi:MFS family permease